MISAIIVDDDSAAAQITELELRRAFGGATVQVVPGQTCSEFLDGLRRVLQVRVWDFLVLDILYQNDEGPRKDWGGVFVYNQLVKEGLRARWLNTIVVTRHYRGGAMVNFAREMDGPGLDYRDQKSVEEFILYAFAATAGIPLGANGLVLPAFTNERSLLIQRIRGLIP